MYSKKRQLLEQKCPDFPPELIEHYRSEGYWLNDTFDVSLKEMAKKYGDRPALTEGDVTISYADLSNRVESLTHGYLQLGLQRVMLSSCNFPIVFVSWKAFSR